MRRRIVLDVKVKDAIIVYRSIVKRNYSLLIKKQYRPDILMSILIPLILGSERIKKRFIDYF